MQLKMQWSLKVLPKSRHHSNYTIISEKKLHEEARRQSKGENLRHHFPHGPIQDFKHSYPIVGSSSSLPLQFNIISPWAICCHMISHYNCMLLLLPHISNSQVIHCWHQLDRQLYLAIAAIRRPLLIDLKILPGRLFFYHLL